MSYAARRDAGPLQSLIRRLTFNGPRVARRPFSFRSTRLVILLKGDIFRVIRIPMVRLLVNAEG